MADLRATPPAITRDSLLLRGAYGFALFAHHGERREGDTDIDHPVAVAELLAEAGFEETVVAAALLHDVIEDTATSPAEIDERFGSQVAALVREMTENERIADYGERKAEHRGRVAGNPPVAAIYAADKLANTRAKDGTEIPDEQLAHYVATLETLSESNPELPFLGPLREELEELLRQRRQA